MKRPTIQEKVPHYLHPFVAQQDPNLYTAIDHAGWRYIMRVSKAFFAKHAHQKYLDGLRDTGISTERVPLISEMDAKLQEFGWRAVAIVGFIPPAVFMEFLSLGILPIACDMRRHEHLSYTPAPDIVHEAAGHAPIIADQEYADYLFQYGEIARKVIFSDQDMEVYESIRNLSDLKEAPDVTSEQIQAAQKRFEDALAAVDYVSEATELARMGWWTTEYGLVGDLKAPKIYGAGLLSSVGESYHCLSSKVKKIPFSVDCIKTNYDITRPQPQLFVTPDFQTLMKGLDQLASTMAYRQGGLVALEKALRAKTVTTAVFDSGIEIGGVLTEIVKDSRGAPCYLRYQGPCQLAYGEVELEGQGAEHHREGFGTPVGALKGSKKNPADLSRSELDAAGGRLEFESGVVVQGDLRRVITQSGKNVILVFENCKVTLGSRVLFDPAWGVFDMACGSKVLSVYGGAPDRGRFLASTGGYSQKPAVQKTNRTPENADLEKLYARVRATRESSRPDQNELESVFSELERRYPGDWLLRLELLEFKGPWERPIRKRLEDIGRMDREKGELITRGLGVL